MTCRRSEASSRASEASTSASSEPAGPDDGRSNGTTTAPESSPSTGPMFPDMETSQRSTGRESSPSTLSLAASPASRSASPGRWAGRPMIVGYGPSSPDAFASYDPATSSWRTSQDSWLDTEGWGTSLVTWPPSGMTRNGTAFQRQPLVPRTSVTGSGSWPTPQAQMPGAGPDNAKVQNLLTGSRHSFYLTQAVEAERQLPGVITGNRWPTPTARDHKDGQYNPNVPVNGLLGRAVWPTPTSADGLGGPGNSGRDGGENLRTAAGGALNPTWVEWLQGFPLGWTDLEED
jgi:hypothetical protein